VGCYIGNIYAGAVGYADDVSLIAPSYCAAKHMLRICEDYAREFDVVFNSSKSVVVVYNGVHNVRLTLNDVALVRYDNAMHLGHRVGNDSNKLNIKKACTNLYNSVNVMLSRFGSCYASTKFNLFCTYCTSFYGCPLWNMESKDVNKFYVAWRKCIRNVWSIPNRTHCNLLHHICSVDPINIQLLYRFGSFYKKTLVSPNILVKLCGQLCTGYTAAASNRRMLFKFIGNDKNLTSNKCIKSLIHSLCIKSEEKTLICHGIVINELCQLRDRQILCELDHDEILQILNYICIS